MITTPGCVQASDTCPESRQSWSGSAPRRPLRERDILARGLRDPGRGGAVCPDFDATAALAGARRVLEALPARDQESHHLGVEHLFEGVRREVELILVGLEDA